jgi:hypothetical protein
MNSRKDNNIDHLIKEYFQKTASNFDKEGMSLQNCPDELVLCDYLENRLNPEKQKQVLNHIAECSHCLCLLALAQRSVLADKDLPSVEMIKRAKNIMPKKSKKKISNYMWPIFTFASVGLSFIFTHYFIQFLVLAVIFGIKWVFDTGSTKTLIMIYEAWCKKDKATAQRIIQGFQDKIEQREFRNGSL